jgi:hypothetical protein
MTAAFRTLAVRRFPSKTDRFWAAFNTFLRLAADYLLQIGAIADAARVYCASFLLLDGQDTAVGSGIFDSFFTNDIFESALIEGGWPLAHELGHHLADDHGSAAANDQVASVLGKYVDLRFPGGNPPWGSHGSFDKLLAECAADRFGVELLLTSSAGRALDVAVIAGELAVSGWITMLMEACKKAVRQAFMETQAAKSAFMHPEVTHSWIYDARREIILLTFRAFLLERGILTEGVARADIEKLIAHYASAESIPSMAEISGALAGSQRCMLGLSSLWPHALLGDHDPCAAEFWDPMFVRITELWARQSKYFRAGAREFVNRAKVTAYRTQPADLIDHLDRLVPQDLPPVLSRPLTEWQIDPDSISFPPLDT